MSKSNTPPGIPAIVMAIVDASVDPVAILGPDDQLLYSNTAYSGQVGNALTGTPMMVQGEGYTIATYRDGAHSLDALHQTVRATTEQLNAAQEQLVVQEKMSALGRLVAGIAHELNNPINYVYGNVEFVEDYLQDLLSLVAAIDSSEHLTAELRDQIDAHKREICFENLRKDSSKLVESIRAGAERAAQIVRDLKNFSRTSSSSFHSFDLVRGVEQTLNLIAPLVNNRIEIRRNYAEDIPPLHCNGGHINQIFMNLLANAAQAIEGEGWIEISIDVVESGEMVRIVVADSGHGISEENQARMTEPFFTTKDVGDGSGLGLWITLGIVHRHQGRLECDSEPGNGAVFTVTLPVGSLIEPTSA